MYILVSSNWTHSCFIVFVGTNLNWSSLSACVNLNAWSNRWTNLYSLSRLCSLSLSFSFSYTNSLTFHGLPILVCCCHCCIAFIWLYHIDSTAKLLTLVFARTIIMSITKWYFVWLSVCVSAFFSSNMMTYIAATKTNKCWIKSIISMENIGENGIYLIMTYSKQLFNKITCTFFIYFWKIKFVHLEIEENSSSQRDAIDILLLRLHSKLRP